MFRVFQLGLVALLLAACFARPLGSSGPRPSREHRYDLFLSPAVVDHPRGSGGSLTDDATAVRSERSTNLSHITGTARKIQMYVKNRHLQILPDGTVNGTSDEVTVCDGCIDYTILQRSSVNNGQLKIQSVATCLFLCMDSCGLLYGSREFTEDCIFNESIEQHYYNTYSSARYSNEKRSLYLALNKRGQPRKVQIRAHAPLGKLSTYTKVLTRNVPTERVDRMVENILRSRQQSPSSSSIESPHHHLRHHGYHQLCPTVPTVKPSQDTDEVGRDKIRCRKRKKRKKKKRKCRDGEEEGEQCQGRVKNKKLRKKCEEAGNVEECLKRLSVMRRRKKQKKLDSILSNKKKKRLRDFKKPLSDNMDVIDVEDVVRFTVDSTTPTSQREEDYYDTTPVTSDDVTFTITSFDERTDDLEYEESTWATTIETVET